MLASRPRRALVTGASRGIGRAIAIRLAEDGYAVTFSARSSESLRNVEMALSEAGHTVTAWPADMKQPADVGRLAERQRELGDCLDALILCAGIGTAGPIHSYAIERAEKQLAVNFIAPFRLVQVLLPLLRNAAAQDPRRGAKVVAIASITGVVAEEGLAAYGASKAALISFCESLTIDEARSGVTASAVSPGFVDTDMANWVRDRVPPDEMISAGDVAEVVHALCRLSRNAAVPNVVLTRPGNRFWRA